MANIKELIAQLKLYAQLEIAFAEKLDELEARVYALEEQMKLVRSGNESNARQVGSLMLRLQSLIDLNKGKS